MGGSEQGRQEETGAAEAWQLDPTGVPRLDEVLGGGIPRGSLALIVGPPGSGKTTLAAQMAFAAGRAGRTALLLTALSEPTNKMVAHLRTYRFFEDDLLGGALQVISLKDYLAQGLPAAPALITADVRRLHASLVVLDGFSGVRGTAGSVQAAREFLYGLGTALSVVGATAVVTNEGTPREAADFPEMTTADVVLGLHYALRGVREQRAIEAIKVRGAAPLPGLHGLELGAEGIRVFPRVESRVARDAKAARGVQARPVAPARDQEGRAAFDLPALDALLGGGLTARTSSLIVGSAGVGKTLLGLQFALAGVRAGRPAVVLSFHETEEELRQKAGAFAFGPALDRALAPAGGLALLRQPAVERDADAMIADLLDMVDRADAGRLVVDSVGELERAITETSGAERIPGCLAALLESLRLRGVTTLLIRETGVVAAGSLTHREELVSLLAANVVWLQQITYRGRLHRVLSVPKMRFSAHDVGLREFTIRAPAGLEVLTTEDSAAGVLAGIARQEGLAEQPGGGDQAAP